MRRARSACAGCAPSCSAAPRCARRRCSPAARRRRLGKQSRLDQREDVVVEERMTRRVFERFGEIGDDRAVCCRRVRADRRAHRPTTTLARGSSNAPADHSGRNVLETSMTCPSISTIVARLTSRQRKASRSVAPSPPPEYQHVAAIAGAAKRRMDERLVIDALVGLRALRIAVDDEHLAEHRRTHARRSADTGTAGEIDFLDARDGAAPSAKTLRRTTASTAFSAFPRTLAPERRTPLGGRGSCR